MRLLRTDKTLGFKWVDNESCLKYAALSHTWGSEELVFSDMISGGSTGVLPKNVRDKKGFQKVTRLAELAAVDGYDFCWIDTACIDKGSSAELGEALNSMYKWYYNAAVCYIFLEDFEWEETVPNSSSASKACLSTTSEIFGICLLTSKLETWMGGAIQVLSMVQTWMDTSRADCIPKSQIL